MAEGSRPAKVKKTTTVQYTLEGVLEQWSGTTEFGIAFRALTPLEQLAELAVLNKGAAKGLKGVVKNSLLGNQYKKLIGDKMRDYLGENREQQASMFHAPLKFQPSGSDKITFLSVGEWVEVDADRTPGYNSEGGIGVVIAVCDDLADVKYVLTKRTEKLVPLRRLTNIIMPHRGPRASLRQQKKPPSPKIKAKSPSQSDFRKMSAIQILKYGLVTNLWKKEGWLFHLLQQEGIVDGTKQSKKESCWSYYKSQLLYIEALQDAKEDSEFDPRRSEHKIGKDGRFVQQKGATYKPKNPLTVTYLCYAFGVPYPTFKRWKADAFVTKKFVPAHTGKSVLTDKKWAAQIFNARKMYVLHKMDEWLMKHPAKKDDTKGKKVCFY